ncbi:hypothetical protein LXL04_008855 [Taraxacum kok-saghyz]
MEVVLQPQEAQILNYRFNHVFVRVTPSFLFAAIPSSSSSVETIQVLNMMKERAYKVFVEMPKRRAKSPSIRGKIVKTSYCDNQQKMADQLALAVI